MTVAKRVSAFILAAALMLLSLAAVTLTAHASGGITRDSSTPAPVLKTNSTATTITTAAFSPPAGSYVIVALDTVYNHNTATSPTVTAKDSLNMSYAAGPHAYDGAAEGSFVFSHYYATAPGSVTVTITRSGQTGAAMLEMDAWVYDGAASSQAGAATKTNTSHSSSSYTAVITTTQSNSMVVAAAAVGTNETLTAHNVVNDHIQGDVNDGASSGAGHAVTGTPGAETLGWTGSTTFFSVAELEVLPAPATLPPVVVTNAATSVSSTTATLNGTVNPESQSTTYQFDYGLTTSYGTSVPVPAGSAGSGMTAVAENAGLTGLTVSTAYHFRIEAANATGTSFGSDAQFTTTSGGGGGLLTWSPPACGGADGLTCTTINLGTGPQNPSLASNVDYKLIMPGTPITGGTLQISGGHNVQVIGGEIDLVNPCSDSCGAQGNGAIYITDGNPGEVYLEGVLIHNTQTAQDTGSNCPGGGMSCSTADGIDVNVGNGGNPATPPAIVMQNIRVDGVSGCSGGSDHADVFQPYNAGSATVNIDHLTGTGNCQGMQTDPDYGFANFGTLPTYNIKNVNMDVLNNPYSGNNNRYMWWLTYNTACNSGPVSLSNDYTQEPNGTMSVNSVWPDTDQPTACKSVWSSPVLSFPNSPQVSGVLTEGLPPGGDYVPVGTAGIGYVSPGYM
jgi:hypothetical protein